MISSLPRLGLLWAQFSPYHIDRCRAAAALFGSMSEVIAVEVASYSTTYAWEPSGDISEVNKITLFPGQNYDDVAWINRFYSQFRVLSKCRTVFIGINYGEPDIILLVFCLRLIGVRVVMLTESKFDDIPRRVGREYLKALLLAPYSAAIVGGHRQAAFLRFLGFHRRQLVQGYDTVCLSRIREQGGGLMTADDPAAEFNGRPFVFIGRFVRKKAVPFLIDCYARYCELSGFNARRLVLVGSGELEAEVREKIEAYNLNDNIDIVGFLQADGVARVLASGLALILPSTEEQWGLVVNEAMAFSLPVIVSESVGARDILIRNLVNGFVVEVGSVEGFARAMLTLSADEAGWRRMAGASRDLAPAGDAARFAEACAAVAGPTFQPRKTGV